MNLLYYNQCEWITSVNKIHHNVLIFDSIYFKMISQWKNKKEIVIYIFSFYSSTLDILYT